ncbi:UBX domain-containing protein 10 [Thecaphora frezii]
MDDTSKQAALSEARAMLRASATTEPDEAVLTALLEIEGWNVQSAVRVIQDDSAAERRRSGADDEEIARSFATTRPPPSSFDFDDSAANGSGHGGIDSASDPSYSITSSGRNTGGVGLSGSRGPLGHRPGDTSVWSIVWSAITLPLSLTQSILLLLFRVFRLRELLPGLFGGSSGPNGRAGMPKTDPRICAERFVRELEEETGASSIPPSSVPDAATSPGSSSDSGAAASAGDATKAPARSRLPPFFIGGYSDALKLAKEQIKILLVILTSCEHGDIGHFRKRVLVDPELVELVSRPDFVVWGGDVREREAYQVATQLEATTYPFVAFIAMQPSRAGRRMTPTAGSTSSSQPRPAVLSRLEGSPLTATSAQTIVSHITDVLLPRTNSYLERLRNEKRRRELERELKAEQDRAYEEASRRDAEKVAKKRDEERQRALEAERQRREQEEQEVLRKQKVSWLRWAKHNLVPDEPASGEAAIRLAFRLPDGKNLSRRFRTSDRLESVFAFVEISAAGLGNDDDDDDQDDNHRSAAPAPAGYTHEYQFSLVLGYPRRRIGPELLAEAASSGASAKTVGNIDGLAPSANLIVEGNVGLRGDREVDQDSSDGEDDE